MVSQTFLITFPMNMMNYNYPLYVYVHTDLFPPTI